MAAETSARSRTSVPARTPAGELSGANGRPARAQREAPGAARAQADARSRARVRARAAAGGEQSLGAVALAPASHIRWDRVGRVAMLLTLLALLYLAISPARSLLADLHLTAQRRAQLDALKRRAAALEAEEHALKLPGARSVERRNLGLVRRGEHSYVVYNLPDN
jgi:cell division protein FtsB